MSLPIVNLNQSILSTKSNEFTCLDWLDFVYAVDNTNFVQLVAVPALAEAISHKSKVNQISASVFRFSVSSA